MISRKQQGGKKMAKGLSKQQRNVVIDKTDHSIYLERRVEFKCVFETVQKILFSRINRNDMPHSKINNYDVFNIALKRAAYGYTYDETSVVLYDKYGLDISPDSIRDRCANIDNKKILELNLELINLAYNFCKEKKKQPGNRILCCDGTVCQTNVALKKSKYATVSTDTHCNFYISTIFDSELELPIAYTINKNKDERADVVELIGHLKKGDILICDRGYPSYDLLKQLDDEGINYVIRISIKWEYVKYINKKNINDKIFFDTHPLYNKTQTRIIKYCIDSTDYYILTNLFDEKYDVIKNLYAERWSVETFYDKFKNCSCGSFKNIKTEEALIRMVHFKFLSLIITRIMIDYAGHFIGTCVAYKQYNFRCAFRLTIDSIVDDMLNGTNDYELFFCHLLKMCKFVVTCLPGRHHLHKPTKQEINNGNKKKLQLKTKHNVKQLANRDILKGLDDDPDYIIYRNKHQKNVTNAPVTLDKNQEISENTSIEPEKYHKISDNTQINTSRYKNDRYLNVSNVDFDNCTVIIIG